MLTACCGGSIVAEMCSQGTALHRFWIWLFTKLYGPVFPAGEIETRANRSARELTYCVLVASGLATVIVLRVKNGNIDLFALMVFVVPIAIFGAPVLWALWRMVRFTLRRRQ